MSRTCGIAKVSGTILECDEDGCSQWDSDKNQCTVKSFLDTYSLLQIIAMEMRKDLQRMESEEDENDADG